MTNFKTETNDTNASNMVLCWIPGTANVETIPLGESIPRGYRTGLAAYTNFRTMDYEERKLMVFIEAMHLIIRDRCDPDAVHKAFLDLDEYRDGCSDDMPGVANYNPQEH